MYHSRCESYTALIDCSCHGDSQVETASGDVMDGGWFWVGKCRLEWGRCNSHEQQRSVATSYRQFLDADYWGGWGVWGGAGGGPKRGLVLLSVKCGMYVRVRVWGGLWIWDMTYGFGVYILWSTWAMEQNGEFLYLITSAARSCRFESVSRVRQLQLGLLLERS